MDANQESLCRSCWIGGGGRAVSIISVRGRAGLAGRAEAGVCDGLQPEIAARCEDFGQNYRGRPSLRFSREEACPECYWHACLPKKQIGIRKDSCAISGAISSDDELHLSD